jgi:hypothetical protein
MSAPGDERPPDEQASGEASAPSPGPVSPSKTELISGQHSAQEVRARVKRWLRRPPDASKGLWLFLLITLSVDGIAAFTLFGLQLYVARNAEQTLFAGLGAGILAAIGLANFWALYSLRGEAKPTSAQRGESDAPAAPARSLWARDAVIAQLFVLALAVYILWVDLQSPESSTRVGVVAGAVAGAAALCIFVLWGRAAIEWKAAVALTVLVPVFTSAQFWLQNFYFSRTETPLVDFSANLSPQPNVGAGPNHLSATITVHNRSAGRVIVAGALMRITGYEKASPPPPCPTTNNDECVQALAPDLDLSGLNYDKDYRVDPTTATKNKLLYAGLLMPGLRYGLSPGDTQSFQREVDIDPTIAQVRLVRLSASAIFLTQRTIQDTRSCKAQNQKPASLTKEYNDFVNGVRNPIIDPNDVNKEILCKDYEFAHTNVVDWLVGNRSAIRVKVILKDPGHPDLEYPQLTFEYWFAKRGKELEAADPTVGNKISIANPGVVYKDVYVECVPGAVECVPKPKQPQQAAG